jgi:thiamine biosynthesis lipoprotein
VINGSHLHGAKGWALAALVAAASLLAAPPAAAQLDCGDADAEGPHARAERHMGTFVELRAWDVPCDEAEAAFALAFAELARLELLLSEWREGTELAAVNAAAGAPEPVAVGEEVMAVLRMAMAIAKSSDGAFDPTFASLWGLWTFGDDGVSSPPSDVDIETRRKLVDYRRVELAPDAGTVRLPTKGMKVGLGGIAKGFAVDAAAAILRAKGLRRFTLRAGGELWLTTPEGHPPQKVGLQDPRGPGLFGVVPVVADRAVSTSGDYERFFVHEGVRYHHLIDPSTARPARRSRAVTVLAPTAARADAASTAVFVMGPEAGLRFIEAEPDLEAIIVGADNRVYLSSGVPDGIELRPPSP